MTYPIDELTRMMETVSLDVAPIPVEHPPSRKPFTGKIHNWVQDERGYYHCHYCAYKAKKQPTMSEHIARKHPVDAGRPVDFFQCTHCDKHFQTSTDRNQHVSTFHEINYIRCPHPSCDYLAKHKGLLFTHYVRKHMDVDDLIGKTDDGIQYCRHCKKEGKITALLYHVGVCNPLSPISCGITYNKNETF